MLLKRKAMNDNAINILISGVGGQGVLLASEIVAVVFVKAGYDVKMSATSGMSQRDGAVYSHIRIGKNIHSPLIPEGQVDILVAMELSEVAGWIGYLKKQSLVLLLNKQISCGKFKPGSCVHINSLKEKLMKKCTRVLEISYDKIHRELKNIRTVNIFMLGVLSNNLPVKKKYWLKTIREKVPPQTRGLNLFSFELGRRKLGNNEVFKDVCSRIKL